MATNDGLWWAEGDLKERLQRDPAAVLKEQGINVPHDFPAEFAREVARIIGVIWQDGKIIPRAAFRIDPQDEGLLFGNGVWESTRTVNTVPWLWPQHTERIRKTALLLGIPLAVERLPTAHQVGEYVRALTNTDVVVRLNVSAGRRGGVGSVWMTAWPQQKPPAQVRLQTRRSPSEKGQPYQLWKTFQYATRLRVGHQAISAGFDSALLLDEHDNILEASHANIFFHLPGGWVTPQADGGLLPGTVRQMIMEHGPLKIREEVVPKSALKDVSEAFVTNSNLGMVPVTLIDEQQIPVGIDTRRLFDWMYPPMPGNDKPRFVVG